MYRSGKFFKYEANPFAQNRGAKIRDMGVRAEKNAEELNQFKNDLFYFKYNLEDTKCSLMQGYQKLKRDLNMQAYNMEEDLKVHLNQQKTLNIRLEEDIEGIKDGQKKHREMIDKLKERIEKIRNSLDLI